MANVFIPAGIRDKATRDTLIAIVKELNHTNANIRISATSPNPYDTGSIGDIIYASDTDSIWVFTGTLWEKSRISEVHTIGINSVTYGAVNSDPLGWPVTANNFRNNAGTSKALVATLYIDNVAKSLVDHNTYSYLWRKNGSANFSSNTTQRSDTGQTSRSLIIDATDIADQGEDAFTCELTYP